MITERWNLLALERIRYGSMVKSLTEHPRDDRTTHELLHRQRAAFQAAAIAFGLAVLEEYAEYVVRLDATHGHIALKEKLAALATQEG
jgi:hypothetical protein